MWHVSSRSGVATSRTAMHLLLTYLLTENKFLYISDKECPRWNANFYGSVVVDVWGEISVTAATDLAVGLFLDFVVSASVVSDTNSLAFGHSVFSEWPFLWKMWKCPGVWLRSGKCHWINVSQRFVGGFQIFTFIKSSWMNVCALKFLLIALVLILYLILVMQRG